MFTTLVDANWRWTLTVFAGAHMLSWLMFAVVYWLVFFVHGDLEPRHLPPYQDENNFTPCVIQIFDFTSCFLYSIETQSTIGYGDRMITEECPEAIFLVAFQSVVAMIIDGYFGGIIGAKMMRAKHRSNTVLFSKHAVVSRRDGHMCLMFRVGDMRHCFLSGTSIRAQLLRPKKTKEGEFIEQYATELDVVADDMGSDLFLMWPLIVIHKIDEDSPFYNMTAYDFMKECMEIIVILEGSVQSTGQDVECKTSYIAPEILWGHRFEHMVCYNKPTHGYMADFSKFDSTVPVDTPLCSSATWEEYKKLEEDGSKYISLD